MHIERVDVYVIKIEEQDRFGGQSTIPRPLGESPYYFETEWREVYSTRSQSCFVKLTTDTDLVGWGEIQAPIAPEVAATLLVKLLGPMILGMDPRRHAVIYDRFYHSMNVRGHTTGFMLDAMAGIDIALWDLRGKCYEAPVCELLGGPFRTQLSAYVSGIRAATVEERVQVARENIAEGYGGVKAYLGRGLTADQTEMCALHDGLPAEAQIETDLFWKYDLATARRLGRVADELRIVWLEAPLAPENIQGHSSLAAAISTPVAVGEPLRTAREFLEWFQQEALDIAQPDVLRTGLTEGKKIADVADAYHRTVALHTSVFLGVGMAATWHLAAAIPNFQVQEHQPVYMEIANRFLDPRLETIDGQLIVPMGTGLGVTISEERLTPVVTDHWEVTA